MVVYEYLYGFAKSSVGIMQHASLWLTFQFSDQDIRLKDHVIEKEPGVGVYFIHGTGDQACSFQTIALRLKSWGLKEQVSSLHLVSFEGRYLGNGIDYFSQQLLQKIQKNNHNRVILCGHSRGAIIAAWFTQYIAKSADINVLHCICVSGPFRGSYLAKPPLSLFSNSVAQMAKGSLFLQSLREKINEEPNSKYTFCIAGQDNIVPNRSGYVLEYVDTYPDSLYKLDDHGHVSIMTSTRLSQFIKQLINKAVDQIHEKYSVTPSCQS